MQLVVVEFAFPPGNEHRGDAVAGDVGERTNLAHELVHRKHDGDARNQRRALYHLRAERYRDLALLLAAEGKIDKIRLDELLGLVASWKPPRFPLAGRDVTSLGIPPGPRVGQLLGEVRRWWEEGDFAADRATCLDHLREIVEAEGRGPLPS